MCLFTDDVIVYVGNLKDLAFKTSKTNKRVLQICTAQSQQRSVI